MERLKGIWSAITSWWNTLTKRLKIIIISGLVGVILLTIGVNVYLNSAKLPAGYSVLYRNVSTEEATTIYTSLKSQGYSVMIGDDYTIYVDENEVELARFAMASVGLPTSALSYDTFSSNTGFLTTELERKTYLLYQLQDRIQATLARVEGVEGAVVSLTQADENDYAWSSSSTQATASVGLNLRYNFTLEPSQVKAVKYLVARAVPKLSVENVEVFDLNTMVRLSDEEITNATDVNEIQLAFQKSYEENMENKIRKLLIPLYGVDNVAVAATVTLDFDKMISEETVYSPSGDQNTGVIDYLEQYAGQSGDVTASGVVGEEDNTDIAIYPTLYDENGNIVEEKNVVDYLVSYITKQVEKNQAKLIDASVSVIIRNETEEEITAELISALTENVAKAVNLSTADVVVNSFVKNQTSLPVTDDTNKGFEFDWTIIAIIVLAGILIAIIIAVIINARKQVAKRKLAAQQAAEEAERAALIAEKERLEKEKQEILDAQQKESELYKGTIDNIKGFAHDNPQIAASLIKEWLREDGEK